MHKRISKFLDRAGDLEGDDRLLDDIYVPESSSHTVVEDLDAEVEDDGLYECSACPGLTFASLAEVRQHVAGRSHKRRVENALLQQGQGSTPATGSSSPPATGEPVLKKSRAAEKLARAKEQVRQQQQRRFK